MTSKQRRLRQGRRKAHALGIGAGLTAALAAAPAANAATFEVTNLLDNGSPGSLRDAIAAAEATPGKDKIVFESGLTGTLQLTAGDLDLSYPVVITGPGPDKVTVNAAPGSRVFSIVNPGGPGFYERPVTIAGLTISGGSGPGPGAGIYSLGSALQIIDSVVTGNNILFEEGPSLGGSGGGIASIAGSLTVASSVISGNSADGDGGPFTGGGGIFTYVATTTITNTTISGNESGVGGGMLQLAGESTITGSTISGNSGGDAGGGAVLIDASSLVSNSTISGNTAGVGAGIATLSGFYFPYGGDLTVRNSTIARNAAAGYGGGIAAYDYSGGGGGRRAAARFNGGPSMHVLLQNTIVGDNSAPVGPDVDGDIAAEFSLIENTSGSTVTNSTPASNIFGKDPLLKGLGDNGGPTLTMALRAGSPALDAGNSRGSKHDQRGFDRPVDSPIPNSTAPGANGADMGAYERQSFLDGKAIRCKGRPATIVAVPGKVTNGTNLGDVIIGSGKRDVINGRGGPDLICGFGGNDLIRGGKGSDTLLGRKGRDKLLGQAGGDLLLGGSEADRMLGGNGNDAIFGESGNDYADGGNGADKLVGNGLNDRLFGRRGPDRLVGNKGADLLSGGPGPDYLIGGQGNDLLIGGPGIDTLFGLIGGSDRDRVIGGQGEDKIGNSTGNDTNTP